MPRSQGHRRNGDKEPFWQSASAEQATTVLLSSYGELAGAEALLRAFLAERDCNRAAAFFWVTVHGLIANSEEMERLERLMRDPINNLDEIAREIGQTDE